MKTLERLKAVRDYLADPEHWVRGIQYEPAGGLYRDPRYCLIGAVLAYDNGILGKECDYWGITWDQDSSWFQPIAQAMGFANWDDAAEFNNNHTHGELMDRIDAAIEGLYGQTEVPPVRDTALRT